MGSTTEEEFKEKLLWNVKREVSIIQLYFSFHAENMLALLSCMFWFLQCASELSACIWKFQVVTVNTVNSYDSPGMTSVIDSHSNPFHL